MSSTEERVCMCKISQLITGHFDSWRTFLHLPVYHMMLPPHPTPHPPFSPPRLPILLPRQGQLKEMIPPRRKIYERFTPRLPPCLQSALTPAKEPHPSPVIHKAGAHLSGVTGSKSPATCLLWQVLIENQTACIQFKPRSCSLPCYHTGLGILGQWHKDTNHKRMCHNTNMWKSWEY